MAFVYTVICIVDFVVFPIYIGMTRPSITEIVAAVEPLAADTRQLVVSEIMKPYEPKTLYGSGLFHLAFGASLTGVVVKRKVID